MADDICSQTTFYSCMSSSVCLLFGVVRPLSTSVALGIRNRTTDGGYLAAVTPHTVVSLCYARFMAQNCVCPLLRDLILLTSMLSCHNVPPSINCPDSEDLRRANAEAAVLPDSRHGIVGGLDSQRSGARPFVRKDSVVSSSMTCQPRYFRGPESDPSPPPALNATSAESCVL